MTTTSRILPCYLIFWSRGLKFYHHHHHHFRIPCLSSLSRLANVGGSVSKINGKISWWLSSWESKGIPPNATPPRNKALLRDYEPLVSLNKALYIRGLISWGGWLWGGTLRFPWCLDLIMCDKKLCHLSNFASQLRIWQMFYRPPTTTNNNNNNNNKGTAPLDGRARV